VTDGMQARFRGFSRRGFAGLGIRLRDLATYDMKVGLISYSRYPSTRRLKQHDPRFISFDTLPVCDGQTDTLPIAKSGSSIAERDKKLTEITFTVQQYSVSKLHNAVYVIRYRVGNIVLHK